MAPEQSSGGETRPAAKSGRKGLGSDGETDARGARSARPHKAAKTRVRRDWHLPSAVDRVRASSPAMAHAFRRNGGGRVKNDEPIMI
jgi:hypothetical protein